MRNSGGSVTGISVLVTAALQLEAKTAASQLIKQRLQNRPAKSGARAEAKSQRLGAGSAQLLYEMLLKLEKEADCAEIQRALMVRKIYQVLPGDNVSIFHTTDTRSYHSNRNNITLDIFNKRSVELREGKITPG